MRSLTRGARRKARFPSLAGMADAELQAKHDHLINLKKAIDDKLKAVRAELLLRSEANRTGFDEPPLEHSSLHRSVLTRLNQIGRNSCPPSTLQASKRWSPSTRIKRSKRRLQTGAFSL
jgi:hypothetical protein